MKMVKFIIIITLLFSIITTPVFASNGDFYDTKTSVVYKASEYRENSTTFNLLLNSLDSRGNDFVYEKSAKGYNYQKLLDSITKKMNDGKDLMIAFGESITDSTIQVDIPVITSTLKITAIGVYNPVLELTEITVNDSTLVKKAYNGTTELKFLINPNDTTHVTVFTDAALTALTLAGADGVKVVLNDTIINDVEVSSINPINLITTMAGIAPILPTTVTATMSDRTTKVVNVTWVTPTVNQYASVGTFTVSGTISESSTVKATVTVVVNDDPLILISID